MRQGIHPAYNEVTVVCSCGATFKTRSTATEDPVHIELCSQCHPFYTGKQKFVDTGGRVQRFSDKFGNAADSVMAKAAAEKEARIKAAEEVAEASRVAKAAKDATKTDRRAKAEVEEAVASGEAAADLVEVEDAVEVPAADVAEAVEAEEEAGAHDVVPEVPTDEASTVQAPAEEPSE
jgi:large subunit ribosomal protein L31